MRASRLALCTLALVTLSATAADAQQPGGNRPPGGPGMRGQGGGMMKEMRIQDLERQRKNVLDYVNVAPDSMLTFRSTPGVRTYAQQIHHIASATSGILAQALATTDKPPAADTAQVFRNKAALAAFVNASYDFAVKAVREAQGPALMQEKTFFGMTRTGMRWVEGAVEHAAWTLGQTVPYLRMNGVTPPNYLPF